MYFGHKHLLQALVFNNQSSIVFIYSAKHLKFSHVSTIIKKYVNVMLKEGITAEDFPPQEGEMVLLGPLASVS